MTWHDKTTAQIMDRLSSSTQGLDSAEAKARLVKFGKNLLKDRKKAGFFTKFIEQFKDFMIIILLAAAGISLITSMMNGEADFADPIIILCIVIFNAVIGVVQENRAEKSIEALKKISSPTAIVRRNNKAITLPAEDVVPGDIVILKTGSRIPADCRLISCTTLMTDESMLTGESAPAEKRADICVDIHAPLADRRNMVWSGSMVVSGKGEAIACTTGMDTEMGHIASMILSAQDRETPLQKKLSDIGKVLGIAALFICGVIFVIGLFRSIPPFEMFMTAVSLAVAAIPEGLPAIVTVMLAIGVQRMARLGAIVRNLPSVETLGCASVICSDKTGTLTLNKMTVVKALPQKEKRLFKLAALCSDADSVNPTELAILKAANSEGINKAELDRRYPRVSEIPFSSEKKLMSVVVKDASSYLSVTKGAPDVILKLCTHIRENGKNAPMTAEKRNEIITNNGEMARSALRVIAVAYKSTPSKTPCSEGLTFAGLIAMEDPPRSEVEEAVKICKNAGITPVMITGDHPATAAEIARRTGILAQDKKIMTGTELDSITQAELEKKIGKYAVFARVTPSHKVRIVKAWQKNGAVVAMTGDGVNDAPALKAADIGCSMGMSGTDVAKNASDMILTDDNFATIVSAVKQGRGIFSNIKKAVQFLLSSNIGELLTVFLGLIFHNQTPLLAIQLLWVNLVTDSLPAIALGLDPADRYLMQDKPRPSGKSIFADGLWLSILLEGAMIGCLALLGFVIGKTYYDLVTARTMAFCVLSISQLVHSFNMRSTRSIFSVGLFSNKYLVGALLAGLLLQSSVVSVPVLSVLFKITPLSSLQWLTVAILSIIPLLVMELQKLFSRKDDREKDKS